MSAETGESRCLSRIGDCCACSEAMSRLCPCQYQLEGCIRVHAHVVTFQEDLFVAILLSNKLIVVPYVGSAMAGLEGLTASVFCHEDGLLR